MQLVLRVLQKQTKIELKREKIETGIESRKSREKFIAIHTTRNKRDKKTPANDKKKVILKIENQKIRTGDQRPQTRISIYISSSKSYHFHKSFCRIIFVVLALCKQFISINFGIKSVYDIRHGRRIPFHIYRNGKSSESGNCIFWYKLIFFRSANVFSQSMLPTLAEREKIFYLYVQ